MLLSLCNAYDLKWRWGGGGPDSLSMKGFHQLGFLRLKIADETLDCKTNQQFHEIQAKCGVPIMVASLSLPPISIMGKFAESAAKGSMGAKRNPT